MMQSREEKKLLVKQLLDDLIEKHKEYAQKASSLCKELSFTSQVYGTDDFIMMKGVVELGELLGCCIKFVPDKYDVRAVIEYKGFRFVEYFY